MSVQWPDGPGHLDGSKVVRGPRPLAARRPRLRIAMVAPPWLPVPPNGYGGTESVVDLLCDGLVARGHHVTLFAAPGSHSSAEVLSPLHREHPNEIGLSLYESEHVAGAWEEIDRRAQHGLGFDVIHDHSGFTAVAMADRLHTPQVHTIHGAFSEEVTAFYSRHGHKAILVAISESQASSAPEGVHIEAVVPNPIRVQDWILRSDKDDYLLWVGRMDPVKGADRAIAAALRSGRRLLLAGPIQRGQEDYFRQAVEPHLDGDQIRYVGEIRGEHKRELIAGAQALLMPVLWREPFGMVMVEALASGTPVIAFPRGAAAEIVRDGDNGFLVEDVRAMTEAIGRVESISAQRCRDSVAERYGLTAVATAYEQVYRAAARAAPALPAPAQITVSRKLALKLEPSGAGG